MLTFVEILIILLLAASPGAPIHAPNPNQPHVSADDCCSDPPPPECPPACS